MEWYRKPDGEVVFGEVACRNGGGHFVDMHNWANDTDLFREWARAVCGLQVAVQPARRYHVGMVFKRAQGDGRIVRIEGLEDLVERCGAWLMASELLPLGHARRDWKQTLLSDGFVAMRHPDLGTLHGMVDQAIGGLELFAG